MWDFLEKEEEMKENEEECEGAGPHIRSVERSKPALSLAQ